MKSTMAVAIALASISCGDEDTTFQSGKVTKDLTAEERAIKTQKQAEAMGIVSLSFTAGERRSEEIEFDPELGLINSSIILLSDPVAKETTIQKGRDRYLEEFTQGYDGEVITENFDVTEAGKIDILITVDDSQTMAPIQNKLREALPSLLTYLDNVNWTIAINTTTSPCLQETDDGRKYITRKMYDENPSEVTEDYKNLVVVGTKGGAIERGIKTATEGLQGYCGGATTPWRRPDAKPIVLLVTDENNCGSAVNDGCPGQPYLESSYMTSAIPDVRVFGILLEEQNPSHPDCSEIGGYDNFDPIHYKQLISETNGFFDTICQDNYDALLQNISKDVSQQTIRKYALKNTPETTLSLSVDGIELKDGYTVSNDIITLNKDLPLSSKILSATYSYGALDRFTSIKLNQFPDQRTLKVTVNSERLKASDFEYVPKTNTIIFNSQPADQAKILIGFRPNTPLPNTFNYAPKEVIAKTLKVVVDGKEIEKNLASWNFELGQVTINPAPMDESIVEIRYEKEGGRQTLYNLPKIDTESIEDAWGLDPETSKRFSATVKGKHILVPWEEVSNGRKVNIQYNIKYSGDDLKFSIPIAYDALDDIVDIETSIIKDVCKISSLEKNAIGVTCDEDDFGIIRARYEYSYQYTNSFELPVDPREFSNVRVYVDKVETSDFLISEKGILDMSSKFIPLGANIRVLFIP